MEKKIKYLSFIVIAFLFLAMTGVAWAEAQYTLKYGTGSKPMEGWSTFSTPYKIIKQEIETRSKGRIKVELYAGGELGTPTQTVVQTRQGILQMVNVEAGHYTSVYPNIQVFSIPYLFIDRQIAWHMLQGKTAQAIKDDMAQKTGLRPLEFKENGGFRNFSDSKRPLHTAADLKGLKIRTMSSPLHMQIVKDLGASPTPIPFTELYSALQLKVVDGQENAVTVFRWPKLEEVQKYMILDGHVYSFLVNLINEKWLRSLPPDLQAVILQADEMSVKIHNTLSYLEEKKDIEELREMGLDIYDPPLEVKNEFRQLTQKSAIEWMRNQKDIDSKFIDMILEETKEVEKELGYTQ
jgi:tripartite ATP-independent transporter DctP family solute receptor